jgi:hypothetical protein
MIGRAQRWLALAAAAVLIFLAAVLGLLHLISAPRTSVDYLIIGTSATLLALVAVFGGVALVASLRFPIRRR